MSYSTIDRASDVLKSAFEILRQGFPDYENRPQQHEMAGAVHACLERKNRLLVEAGTGVGKSFAYLIPAILSGEKTVVSTATIALQDQLAKKDLVFLGKALPHEFSFDILKGKNNYVCLKRERELTEQGEARDRFAQWLRDTPTGDKEEIPFIPDFWGKVCGDTEDCGGRKCPFFSDCFYYNHFKNLHKVDILVVNHYLLIYDLLSEFTLLPFHKTLIIDEAHEIENVVSHVLGSTVNHSRVSWLLHRLRTLEIAVDHIFPRVDSYFKGGYLPRQDAGNSYRIPDTVIEGLEHLKGLLSLEMVASRLKTYKETAEEGEKADKVETTLVSLHSLSRDIDDFIIRENPNKVYYMTTSKGAMALRSSLVDCQEPFGALMEGYESVVMTSATMSAGGSFSFLEERLGISGCGEKIIGSPFDFKKQALLFIAKDLPPPDHESFQEESLKTMEGLIRVSGGRALVLFTSYKHLHFVSRNLKTDYPVKSQGDMPPARLIQWFKETPDPVLLATATFWQGIDIKGERLSLVIIAKLPFGAPGDPVYDERCKRLENRWFGDLALPSAILLLKQGFGRLIRSSSDQGVVAILASLPEIRTVHNLEDVRTFFDSIPSSRDLGPARRKGVRKKRRSVREL
ncbi:MAG: hypothetical protein HYU64_01460 [Armatimonadetes bacterium]|nr:hypothetical protein [Armatimonadota bacterium]